MGQTAGLGYLPNTRWPNVFMSTAFDLANPPGTKCFWGCVHVFNKQAAAHRLALAARGLVYKEKVVYMGPVVTSVNATAGPAAVITYSEGTEGKGLLLRGSYGFEVLAGTIWQRVPIVANTATTVTIKSSSEFTMVRYGYDDMPSVFYGTGPAVFNTEGIPANPGMWNITTSTY